MDTDKFAANHSTTTQFEVMAMSGPTQVFGELMLTSVNAPTEFNYGYGVLDRGRTQGHFDVFQGRAQFGF